MTTALELIPYTEPGDGPLTVVAMHATGADEHQLVPLARELAPTATLLAPRGTVMEDGHIRRFFRRHGTFDLDVPDMQERADELADALRERLSSLGRDPAGTIALGYSNGANMALAMMFRHPGLFAGAALLRPVLPYVPEPAPDLAGARVLMLSGDRDPYSPPEKTDALASLLRAGEAELTLVVQDGTGHEVGQADLRTTADWFATWG